jgi:hypothetical protein
VERSEPVSVAKPEELEEDEEEVEGSRVIEGYPEAYAYAVAISEEVGTAEIERASVRVEDAPADKDVGGEALEDADEQTVDLGEKDTERVKQVLAEAPDGVECAEKEPNGEALGVAGAELVLAQDCEGDARGVDEPYRVDAAVFDSWEDEDVLCVADTLPVPDKLLAAEVEALVLRDSRRLPLEDPQVLGVAALVADGTGRCVCSDELERAAAAENVGEVRAEVDEQLVAEAEREVVAERTELLEYRFDAEVVGEREVHDELDFEELGDAVGLDEDDALEDKREVGVVHEEKSELPVAGTECDESGE